MAPFLAGSFEHARRQGLVETAKSGRGADTTAPVLFSLCLDDTQPSRNHGSGLDASQG
jgi:hypothetical protein